MDTSQTATPFPLSDRRGDAHPQARVVGLLADLLHADRVEVEHHPVIDVDRSDVAYYVGKMLGGDVGADGVGIDVLSRSPCPVGSQQHSAFKDEVAGMPGTRESIQERFEGVPDQVLLRRCAGPAVRRCGTGGGLEASEHCIAEAQPSVSNACRTGDLARGTWETISISRAGLPPLRSHSRSASRASSYPTSPRSRNASAIDRSAE
jgi:hypothetical protein